MQECAGDELHGARLTLTRDVTTPSNLSGCAAADASRRLSACRFDC